MVYKITLEPDFLRAELFDRDTVEEVKSFLLTVAAASVKHLRGSILLRIHPMIPIFLDDPYALIRHIGALPLLPSWRSRCSAILPISAALTRASKRSRENSS